MRETVVKTAYFDEYNWSSTQVQQSEIQCLSSDGSWVASSYGKFTASNDGSARIRFTGANATAYMMLIVPTNNVIRCMAQGRWIGYDNVANTDAILLPEANNEIDYSLAKYSPFNWVYENGLDEEYNEWLNGYEGTAQDANGRALEWIVETGKYPEYVWWSRKGSGIYRYVGYDILKSYSWRGSEKERGEE